MPSINLNDQLQKAKAGDPDAMKQLCEYYHGIGDEDNADYWDYRLNCNNAVAFGIMAIHMEALEAYAAQCINGWEAAEEGWNNILNKIRDIHKYYEDGDVVQRNEDLRQLQQARLDAYYGLALIAYIRDDDSATAANLLLQNGFSSGKAKALLGICLFENNHFSEAFAVLKDMFTDNEYLHSKKQILEESLMASAIFYLAGMYRVGVQGTAKPDLAQAYVTLTNGISALRDIDLRDKLQRERNHYRQGLFGGYKYN